MSEDMALKSLQESLNSAKQHIDELMLEKTHLEYQLSGMGDVHRISTAAAILAHNSHRIETDSQRETQITRAIGLADELISHYQEIIEKKAAAQMKADQEATDANKKVDEE